MTVNSNPGLNLASQTVGRRVFTMMESLVVIANYCHSGGLASAGIVPAVDGQMKCIKFKEFQVEQTKAVKGLSWWNPWGVNSRKVSSGFSML